MFTVFDRSKIDQDIVISFQQHLLYILRPCMFIIIRIQDPVWIFPSRLSRTDLLESFKVS